VSPNVVLDVIGDIEYTGTITDVSDIRTKENIETLNNSLSKLMQIRGVSFNPIGSSKREFGVIAQEIKQVFPEVVNVVDPEKGYLGVSYPLLIPVLIESVKEQQSIIQQQNNKINMLKAELCLRDNTFSWC